MAKSVQKQAARALRAQGKSINFIAKKLMVSKGSASIWCRNMKLTPDQEKRIRANSIAGGHIGRMIGAAKNKQRRLDVITQHALQTRREVGRLSQRDLLIMAAALFWAEGAKTGSRFVFINSDPDMILGMLRYLTEVERVDPSRVTVTIQINRIHQNRIKKVFKFWSTFLNLPLKQFGKVYYINVIPKKIYDNHDSYYGIVRLRIGSGSSLQYKLLGYIEALKVANKLPG